jgi:hypothetical protein
VLFDFRKPAMSAKMREYQKKKKQKKLQRFKQLEEERESEKKKWINFHNKVSTFLYCPITII